MRGISDTEVIGYYCEGEYTCALHSPEPSRAELDAMSKQVKTVRMCETEYLGPTDTRGARVRARHMTTRKRAIVAWDHALDAFENHANAAKAILGRRPEFATSVDGGGYIMGVDPRNDSEAR